MISSKTLFFFLSMCDLTERFQCGEKAVVGVGGVLLEPQRNANGSRGAVSKGPWADSVN